MHIMKLSLRVGGVYLWLYLSFSHILVLIPASTPLFPLSIEYESLIESLRYRPIIQLRI